MPNNAPKEVNRLVKQSSFALKMPIRSTANSFLGILCSVLHSLKSKEESHLYSNSEEYFFIKYEYLNVVKFV
jgi:hypothetical protein